MASTTIFLITLSDGKRYIGRLSSINDSLIEINFFAEKTLLKFSKKTQSLENPEGNKGDVLTECIVYLKPLDEGFWSSLSFNFDVGTNITKASDFRQFTFNSGLELTLSLIFDTNLCLIYTLELAPQSTLTISQLKVLQSLITFFKPLSAGNLD